MYIYKYIYIYIYVYVYVYVYVYICNIYTLPLYVKNITLLDGLQVKVEFQNNKLSGGYSRKR